MIERRTRLKRTGLKPPTIEQVRAWQSKPRKRIPKTSKKRRGERLARAEVVLYARRRDGGCVGRGLIPGHHCRGPLDGHEVIPRSAWPGGHLVLDNVRTVCRAAHDWIGGHERDAAAIGLHGYSWDRPDDAT